LTTLRRILALYQTGYRIASILLKRNYDFSFADCERPLPFNYQVEEFLDPRSNLHSATPSLLAIFNAAPKATRMHVTEEVKWLLTASQGH